MMKQYGALSGYLLTGLKVDLSRLTYDEKINDTDELLDNNVLPLYVPYAKPPCEIGCPFHFYKEGNYMA